jgi:hypothetical protein
MWVWVSTKHFTVQLDVKGELITRAAPICRYAVGKKASWFKDYLTQRGILLDWIEFK